MVVDKKTEALIRINEGECLFPYTDTVGKITIGVGRNLTDRGISKAESDFLLSNDEKLVVLEVLNFIPWISFIDEVRRGMILDLCFNLGITKFKFFLPTLELIRDKNYEAAATHLRSSLWFKQVGLRGLRAEHMILSGGWPKDIA